MSGKKMVAACGNHCSACPRYTAFPHGKTEEELRRTAELWMKIGYRDRIVPNEEISCTGCKPENWCRFGIAGCCAERGKKSCAECGDYPCDRARSCFAVTKSFELNCMRVCTAEEYAQLKEAFFEKENNLKELRDQESGPASED